MYLSPLVLVLALFQPQVQSELPNPPDVTFVIEPSGGNVKYRPGEEIVFEFRLSSTTPKRYVVEQLSRADQDMRPFRWFMRPPPFVVEPVSGTVDPLIDLPPMLPGVGGGLVGAPRYLNDVPLVTTATLNESVSFRSPGRYRVTATTRQINIPLRSNTVEIEIVPADPEWQAERLRDALALLRTADQRQWLQGARALRFLETRDAALALAELFTEKSNVVYVGDELRLGLVGSPYRKEILDRLESHLEAAGIAISQNWMDALIELATAAVTGPRPLPDARTAGMPETEYRKMITDWWLQNDRHQAQFTPVSRRYYDKLAAAVERKEGQARTITLDTLASRPR